METPFPVGFFALQVAFARRMSTLVSAPLAETMMTTTGFYRMLDMPGDFDAGEPAWRALLERVDERASESEQARAIHLYYMSRFPGILAHSREKRRWGCFGFDWRPAQSAIRIHFSNQERLEPGALSQERRAERQAELRAMFAVVRAERPEAEWVIGGSWLYNLEAYRRIYPPSFGASARATEPELQYMALWGQFLRRDRTLNTTRSASFRMRLAALDDPANNAACFPCQVLLTRARIGDFYSYYGV